MVSRSNLIRLLSFKRNKMFRCVLLYFLMTLILHLIILHKTFFCGLRSKFVSLIGLDPCLFFGKVLGSEKKKSILFIQLRLDQIIANPS
jgi:hypothetical protein